jgi:hypothetical protein
MWIASISADIHSSKMQSGDERKPNLSIKYKGRHHAGISIAAGFSFARLARWGASL